MTYQNMNSSSHDSTELNEFAHLIPPYQPHPQSVHHPIYMHIYCYKTLAYSLIILILIMLIITFIVSLFSDDDDNIHPFEHSSWDSSLSSDSNSWYGS